MSDPHRLSRFVEAQERDGTYARALDEIRAGRKRSHWMWFVFPQIAGLGRSSMAQRYAIGSLAEARAYLDHPVLGPRLRQSARALRSLASRTPEEVFGPLDAMKLRSSMTLFHRAAPDEGVFGEVLETWFAGTADPGTVEMLGPRDA